VLAIRDLQTGNCSDPDLFVKAERVTRTAEFCTSDSDSSADSSSESSSD
jgi:hypothetical protein